MSLPPPTTSTFQFSGRPADADIAAMSATCSSENGPTVGMNSKVVPGWSPTTRDSATSSSRVAARDGTGSPSPSLWVGACDDEKPNPPAASDSPSVRHIVVTSSSVAGS